MKEKLIFQNLVPCVGLAPDVGPVLRRDAPKDRRIVLASQWLLPQLGVALTLPDGEARYGEMRLTIKTTNGSSRTHLIDFSIRSNDKYDDLSVLVARVADHAWHFYDVVSVQPGKIEWLN